MKTEKFLLFVPQLPSAPSRPRVKVWRDLRAAGAISLQNGIWILPQTEHHEKLLQKLLAYVEKNDGTANLMVTEPQSPTEHDKIIQQFHQERREEYEEFIEHCEEFLGEIKRETAKSKFTYAELEESEDNFKRLEKWFNTILTRDHLNEPTAKDAKQSLEECRTILDQFTEHVYALENLDEHNLLEK